MMSDTLKEIITFVLGFVVGGIILFVVYGQYKDKLKDKQKRENLERKQKNFNNLVENQSFVELLTVKELSSWFYKYRSQFNEKIKMLIVVPTEEILAGLGLGNENKLDTETHVLQMFYNEETGEALKMRLVNFTEIESNLQARLIEDEGMIVVTD